MEKAILDCVAKYDPELILEEKQRECLEHIYTYENHRNDLIANLPVCCGKSLIYHVLPSLVSTKKSMENGCVLVISPLNFIHTDQMESLRHRAVSSCRLDITGRLTEEGEISEYGLTTRCELKDVEMGKYSVILCHPEARVNTARGREPVEDPMFQEHVLAVVIDECLIVEEWANDFRTAFGRLTELPATFPNIPFIGLSRTLTTHQLESLPDQLGMKNPSIVQQTPDRPNIFLCVEKKESGDGDVITIYEKIYKFECDHLYESVPDYPVTLMFLPLRYMSCALKYLVQLFGKQGTFSSPKTKKY